MHVDVDSVDVRFVASSNRDATDAAALFALGEHLFEKYLEAKWKEWDVFREAVTDWELKQMGGGNLRVSAEGVKVYVRGGLISEYQLDLGAIFAADTWGPWRGH